MTGDQMAPSGRANTATGSLYECAEHAVMEMRDRFDLKRGDSASLDALEDALLDAGEPVYDQFATKRVVLATGRRRIWTTSGESYFDV